VTEFHDSDPFLLVSTFTGSPIGKGHVYVVPEIKEAVINNTVSKLKEQKLDTGISLQWPNDVKLVPSGVFEENRSIVIPDGFLVPGHADGGIYVVVIDDDDITKVNSHHTITHNKDGYFYHMGEWIDMNKDGRKDFVTAKSNAKEDGGRLVWYEQPEGGLSATDEWVEHVVTEGPDVGILIDQDSYNDSIIVYAAEFFTERVGAYRVSTKDGTLMDSKVIDDGAIQNAYSVTIVDLNGDGQDYLMVNNHEKDEDANGIWAYKMPKTKNMWKDDAWEKTQIASHFVNAFNLFIPGMSPGFPYPIWPYSPDEKKGKAPNIVIAGDGDYSCWIMSRTGDLTYDRDLIEDAKGTVGALAQSDLDGDDWKELWMPNYDKNYIEVYKFHAKSNATIEELPTPVEILQ